MQTIHSNHVVNIAKFFEVFTEDMHGFSKVCTLLLYLSRGVNHFLVEYLVTISEILESCAEDHCVLVHVNTYLTILCH